MNCCAIPVPTCSELRGDTYELLSSLADDRAVYSIDPDCNSYPRAHPLQTRVFIMLKIRLAVAVLALAVTAHRAQGQLVTNGGFESGDLSGWTLTGSVCTTAATSNPARAHSGSYGLQSGPVFGNCTLSQSIATTAGGQYTFSFWVANLSGDRTNSFAASWDGGVVYAVGNGPEFAYTQQMFAVNATSATTTIAFTIRHDPSWYLIDDVSVVAAITTVPEPSTYALLAAGLLGIMVVRRRWA